MGDFDDRLAALDPAAGQPYQHRNLDALISKITAEPRHTPRRLWRNIELKVAGTLIAGSLVAAATVALVQGAAPTLPTLALASVKGAQFSVSAEAPAAGPLQPYAEYNFSGDALSTNAPSSLSYRLSLPRDGAKEASHIASVFGVEGSARSSSSAHSDWMVKSATGSALDYENSGVPQWYYSSTSPAIAPATKSSTPVNPLPSQATVAADVQRYLALLGFDYGVASPNFSTSTTSSVAINGSSQVTSSTEDVTYTVIIGGLSTDQTVSFSVGQDNVLAYASGPAFDVGPSYRYPLEAPVAGVAQLNAAQKAEFATTGGGASATSGPPVLNVALNSDALSLGTYELTDGSWWFLPIFHYQGTFTGTSGVASTGTWNELAIEPSYVTLNPGVASTTP